VTHYVATGRSSSTWIRSWRSFSCRDGIFGGSGLHPLFTTDSTMAPARVIELFVWRWSLEVTFEEVRRHLGVETQRQWTDLAIARTTPALMGLFSLVCLMVYQWRERWATLPRSTAWYLKSHATFSDCLALVRRTIWSDTIWDGENYVNSTSETDRVLISPERLDRLLDQITATA
jgi:hypothetical protein